MREHSHISRIDDERGVLNRSFKRRIGTMDNIKSDITASKAFNKRVSLLWKQS